MTRHGLVNTKGINSTLTFGKYKGKTVLQVIDENPSYIVWCIRNVTNFSIDPILSKELCRQYDEHFRKYDLARANGYTESDVKKLMSSPYNMHVTEAISFLEYG